MNVTSEINKSCPVMVDRETRLDNAMAGAGKTLIYSYTLVNVSIGEINVPQVETSLKPRIINVVKTSSETKFFRDKGVTLIYKYSDKVGVSVMEFKITPDDYR
ncbi:MAG: hypothetical protein WAO19_06660 [Candidatus Kryptoniota bacterium]